MKMIRVGFVLSNGKAFETFCRLDGWMKEAQTIGEAVGALCCAATCEGITVLMVHGDPKVSDVIRCREMVEKYYGAPTKLQEVKLSGECFPSPGTPSGGNAS